MDKSFSYHQYYQIAPPAIPTKFRSKSSESLSNNNPPVVDAEPKQPSRKTKLKKSHTALVDFQAKSGFGSSSALRRRLSLFRTKRSLQADEHSTVHTLQQNIDQLKQDLLTKNTELEGMKEFIESKRRLMRQTSSESIEQAMQLQLILHSRLEEMLRENELLKKTIHELESYAQQQQQQQQEDPPNSPSSSSLLTTAFSEPSTANVKSTNFTHSMPVSRVDVRHKSEIEVEVRQQQQQQQQLQQMKNTFHNNVSPLSTSSYPPVVRPVGITNNRAPTIFFDENIPGPHYQIPKRRQGTSSTQTQTLHPNEPYLQQLKALNEETTLKNEKIHVLLRELTDCQAIIKQQEQQLVSGKKEREQLCCIVDERSNELRNLKQKNEQLEQMIRNEHEHKHDEKKLLALLQESQDERDQLISQQRQTHDRIYKFEEQLKYYENDAANMRDHLLCAKIKLEKKLDENECLTSELTNMKKLCDRLEQDNQKFKLQIDFERKQHDECAKLKALADLELQNSMEKCRSQRFEYETQLANLDDSLKYSQKQSHHVHQNQRLAEEKHDKEVQQLNHHIHELEVKIEEVIKDKALLSLRCGELMEENRKLEKALSEKEDDYEEKISCYKEKNLFLSAQVDEVEKKLAETRKQLEIVTVEKDETLADMLVAVRVASELRYDAEDRLNKANDDLKRVTEHIQQERTMNKAVQRKQLQSTPSTRNPNEPADIGQVKIKELIRTLEANSQHSPTKTSNNHPEPTTRQRPLSHPSARTETRALSGTSNHRPFDTSTDDAKILSSTKTDSPQLNATHRSDISARSITNEQYDEMKSIVEAVFARTPGSVCKRDALLKWCVERLDNYGVSITNFSNSWTDGIAFCALLHSYLPDRIDLGMIKEETKKKRFEIAFDIASSVGIVSVLDVDEMCSSEWPDWERVMYYVALIFRHFECSPSTEAISPILPIPQTPSSPLSTTFNTTSSPSLCVSLRSPNAIPTKLCSPLQTV